MSFHNLKLLGIYSARGDVEWHFPHLTLAFSEWKVLFCVRCLPSAAKSAAFQRKSLPNRVRLPNSTHSVFSFNLVVIYFAFGGFGAWGYRQRTHTHTHNTIQREPAYKLQREISFVHDFANNFSNGFSRNATPTPAKRQSHCKYKRDNSIGHAGSMPSQNNGNVAMKKCIFYF